MKEQQKDTGVLLMNLGSPDSTDIPDVKKYLTEFLMDKRVIDSPYLIRSWIVKRLIVPKRTPKSAEAYASIWLVEGAPLLVLTKQLKSALQNFLKQPVSIAMRYGNPTPKAGFDDLLRQNPNIKEVILVPLYPQYAMSSYETATLYAEKHYKKYKYPFRLRTLQPYYKDPAYIQSLADSIAPYLNTDYDHILFSYHGVPKRHIFKGDITKNSCLRIENCCHTESSAHPFCYRHQCITTTDLVVKKLQISKHKSSISFQSRLGNEEWLKPYSTDRFHTLPKQGIKKLLVACPAFVSDCLETLEEIAEEGKHNFLSAGGEQFTMIPCLNTHPTWIGTLANYIQDYKNRIYPRLLTEILK